MKNQNTAAGLGEIMPYATVAAIITTKESSIERILLTRRSIEPFNGLWCLPGGHIEKNEVTSEAIAREVKEETGIDFTPSFLGYFDEIIPERNIHAVVLVFVGMWTGNVVPNKTEVSEVG